MTSANSGAADDLHPPLSPRVAALLDRDHAVLTDVARFRLLSGRQLRLLHFAGGASQARAARRALLRLTTAAMLHRLPRRIGGLHAGSDGFVYAISRKGLRTLAPDTNPGRPDRYVSERFIDHTLAIADVYVRLVLAIRDKTTAELQVWPEPTCWRRLESSQGVEWLKPDLLVAVTMTTAEDTLETHSFIEVDRGTEHAPAIQRKARAYELAYRLGITAVTPGLFPRVVWIAPNEARANRLRQILGDLHGTEGLHVVTTPENARQLLPSDDSTAEAA